MTSPPPVSFYSPRYVRLIRGIVTCYRCHKPVLHSIVQNGWAFQRCHADSGRGQRVGRCTNEWWLVALPPDAFGGYLAAELGNDPAIKLIRRLWPDLSHDKPDDELWGLMLNEGEETAWIQVAVQPSERHWHRKSPLKQLLRAFSLL